MPKVRPKPSLQMHVQRLDKSFGAKKPYLRSKSASFRLKRISDRQLNVIETEPDRCLNEHQCSLSGWLRGKLFHLG